MNGERLQVCVFRTDVEGANLAVALAGELSVRLAAARVTFDLDDHDKVLRIEGVEISIHDVINFLHERGHYAELLD